MLYIQIVMGSLLFFTSLIMIFLILIQRGRGGGLAGALGGSGGSSAFGAKAGDTFTRITAGMAIFWFVLCLLSILLIQGRRVAPLSDREPAVGTGAAVPAEGGQTPISIDDALNNLPSLDLPKDIDTKDESLKDSTDTTEDKTEDKTGEATDAGAATDAGDATGAGDAASGETGGTTGSGEVPKTDGSGL